MLQPSPTSPSRRSPTPVLDRSRTPNVHASSGHAAQFHALGFWILALTFGAQHAEEIGATLELVQNLLCLEDQMRTRGARALRTSSNHHARARAHHPLHAEVLAAPTTLHLLRHSGDLHLPFQDPAWRATTSTTAPAPHRHSGGLHLPFHHPAWRATTSSTHGCAHHNSDVIVCCFSCSGKFNQPTFCTWPRISSCAMPD